MADRDSACCTILQLFSAAFLERFISTEKAWCASASSVRKHAPLGPHVPVEQILHKIANSTKVIDVARRARRSSSLQYFLVHWAHVSIHAGVSYQLLSNIAFAQLPSGKCTLTVKASSAGPKCENPSVPYRRGVSSASNPCSMFVSGG